MFVAGHSFDEFNTNAQGLSHLYYSQFNVTSFATGRFGVGRCITMSGVSALATAIVPAMSDPIVAFAWNQASGLGSGLTMFAVGDASAGAQLNIFVNADGTVSIRRGTTVIAGPSTLTVAPAVWYWVELKATIATSATGSVALRINGVDYITLTASVQTSTTATINRLFWTGNSNGVVSVDDWFVLNTSGSFNNDFPGEARGDSNFPTGVGSNAAWTSSTASANWTNVDDNPPNDDTDYNSSSTVGQVDTHTHTAQSLTGNIIACVKSTRGRKDDAGGRSFRGVVKSGATTVDNGSDHVMSSTYQSFPEVWETDPATGSQWTLTGLNASEWGYKVTA